MELQLYRVVVSGFGPVGAGNPRGETEIGSGGLRLAGGTTADGVFELFRLLGALGAGRLRKYAESRAGRAAFATRGADGMKPVRILTEAAERRRCPGNGEPARVRYEAVIATGAAGRPVLTAEVVETHRAKPRPAEPERARGGYGRPAGQARRYAEHHSVQGENDETVLRAYDEATDLGTATPYTAIRRRPVLGPEAPAVAAMLEALTVYRFPTEEGMPLRGRAPAGDNAKLRRDGGNLAPYLLRLGKEHPGAAGRIREAVREAAEEFGTWIDPEHAEAGDEIGLRWQRRGSPEELPVTEMRPRTLRTLAMAAVLLAGDRELPATVIVNEPEMLRGPGGASGVVARMIREAAASTDVLAGVGTIAAEDLPEALDGAEAAVEEPERIAPHAVEPEPPGEETGRTGNGAADA